MPALSPFRLNAGTDDVFVHPGWAAAERQILASLAEGQHVLLCGPPGTGKSLMLRALGVTLTAAGVGVALVSPPWDAPQMPEVGLVIADEVDGLALVELQALVGREYPVVLAGLPTAAGRIAEACGPLGTVTMGLVDREVVGNFLAAQLARYRRSTDMFEQDAVSAIVADSEGLFRTVVTLAGAALFCADQRGSSRVSTLDVAEAVAMRGGVMRDADADWAALRAALAQEEDEAATQIGPVLALT